MKQFHFGSGTKEHPKLWNGEPGDIVEQHGPRIGVRWWLVIDVHHGRIWSCVTCVPMTNVEYITEAAHTKVWTLGKS